MMAAFKSKVFIHVHLFPSFLLFSFFFNLRLDLVGVRVSGVIVTI